MYPHSHPLTIGRTVLTDSDDFKILAVTFELKMTFEKHLYSIFCAASRRFGILRKSWGVFNDIFSSPLEMLPGFVLSDSEHCSALRCSANDAHHASDRVVGGVSFSPGGVLECDAVHSRSVSVLYMVWKITLFMELYPAKMYSVCRSN